MGFFLGVYGCDFEGCLVFDYAFVKLGVLGCWGLSLVLGFSLGELVCGVGSLLFACICLLRGFGVVLVLGFSV